MHDSARHVACIHTYQQAQSLHAISGDYLWKAVFRTAPPTPSSQSTLPSAGHLSIHPTLADSNPPFSMPASSLFSNIDFSLIMLGVGVSSLQLDGKVMYVWRSESTTRSRSGIETTHRSVSYTSRLLMILGSTDTFERIRGEARG